MCLLNKYMIPVLLIEGLSHVHNKNILSSQQLDSIAAPPPPLPTKYF